LDFEVTAGESMQPFGLNKEATEQQNAQNYYDRNYDYLDEAHNKLPKVEPKRATKDEASRILKATGQSVNEAAVLTGPPRRQRPRLFKRT
jgi:hypothetical protein